VFKKYQPTNPMSNYEMPAAEDDEHDVPLISCPIELLRYGIVARVPLAVPGIISDDDWRQLARTMSVVTPAILTAEGDGEYAFYRNILEEPDFPFDAILCAGKSPIAQALLQYFSVQNLETEIRLDDAFCIHYQMDQGDTRGAKHMDPSDITVNLCLEKSDDCQGSHVLFHGTKALAGGPPSDNDNDRIVDDSTFRFLVNQEPGYATLHWGNHPHETTRLMRGHRTNIVVTYCYTDKSRSDVSTRDCYNV
jgi:hypothetical protein